MNSKRECNYLYWNRVIHALEKFKDFVEMKYKNSGVVKIKWFV